MPRREASYDARHQPVRIGTNRISAALRCQNRYRIDHRSGRTPERLTEPAEFDAENQQGRRPCGRHTVLTKKAFAAASPHLYAAASVEPAIVIWSGEELTA